MLEIKLDLIEECREEYSQASPWPYCVVDGMWSPELLKEIIQEWPDSKHPSWIHVGETETNRYRNPVVSTFPPNVQKIFSYFDSPELKAQLEKLTGYQNLILDPKCSLLEGMHLNSSGACLGQHQDALWNEEVQGYRVLNLLLYLNSEWKEENGGELVLWDAQTKTPIVTIPPLFNRTIIMSVNEGNIHGTWPIKDMERKSLAVYYYVLESQGPKTGPLYFQWA